MISSAGYRRGQLWRALLEALLEQLGPRPPLGAATERLPAMTPGARFTRGDLAWGAGTVLAIGARHVRPERWAAFGAEMLAHIGGGEVVAGGRR
jgi:hypothetical protein